MNLHELVKGIVVNTVPDKVLLELKKRRYARALRTFYEDDLAVIKLLARPGDHVIDIGANVGWYTNVLSTFVGEHGRVYSIEPIGPTFELLSYSIKKLGLTNVAAINCAISDDNGVAAMEIPSYGWAGEYFYQARIVDARRRDTSFRRFTVEVQTLDSLVSRFTRPITFIKCDVEGHELRVLNGARRLVEESRPAWHIEVSADPDRPGSAGAMAVDTLLREGYMAYWFDGQRLRRRRPGDKSINYFFLAERHTSLLNASGMAVT